MGHEIFTASWAEAWCRELNGSGAYADAARDWEGAIVLVLAPDASYGIPEARAVYVDLWHGECREAREATREDREEVPYLIRADPYTWNRVLEGETDPVASLMQGRLKLKRGSVMSMARYVNAARELVRAATRVDTTFPESWP